MTGRGDIARAAAARDSWGAARADRVARAGDGAVRPAGDIGVAVPPPADVAVSGHAPRPRARVGVSGRAARPEEEDRRGGAGRHRRLLVLAGLVLLAVTLRVALGMTLLATQGGPAFVLASDDGDAYDAAARFVALGEPIPTTPRLAGKWDASTDLTDRWPQGYWLFLAAAYRLVGSAYGPAILLQGLLGGVGVVAAWSLARQVLVREPWALVAAGGVALSSTGIYLSASLYAEALFVPLVLIALACATRARRAAFSRPAVWRWGLASGVGLALAEVTRPVALAVWAVVLVWTVAPFGDWSPRQRLAAALTIVVGFATGIAPFGAHDLLASGHISVLTAGGTAAFGDSQRAAQLALADRVLLLFVSGGWAPLGEPLLAWLGAPGVLLRGGLFVLSAVGLVLVCRPNDPGVVTGRLVAGAILALVGTALAVGLPLVRYRAAADPLLIVCLCAALARLRPMRVFVFDRGR